MSIQRYLLACALAPCALAQTQSGPPEPEVRRAEFGFEQRVRTENWNNIMDYGDNADDEREQIRYRTRVWANVPLPAQATFFVGLTQETTQKLGKVNTFDEVIFDSLYLDFQRLPIRGLSLRIGRQPLMRGEGFVLFDGTSGDGSRTQYFNAVNLAYSFRKSKIELIGMLDPAQDHLLPRWHDQHKLMQTWDESALGLYYTDSNLKNTTIESYYFYKKEVHDRTSPKSVLFQPDRHIGTFGGRVTRVLNKQWSATGEYAWQWGAQHGGRNIAGWGGYGYVKRSFDHVWRPYAKAGYWAMSGDDPKTNDIEGWDPIFSRWPKWSELFVYSQVRETGVAYASNINLWQAEVGARPNQRLNGRLTYYRVGAFQPLVTNAAAYGNGLTRGNMMQAFVEYRFNPMLKGHAIYERMLPGDFYATNAPGYFVRFELLYQVVGRLKKPIRN